MQLGYSYSRESHSTHFIGIVRIKCPCKVSVLAHASKSPTIADKIIGTLHFIYYFTGCENKKQLQNETDIKNANMFK